MAYYKWLIHADTTLLLSIHIRDDLGIALQQLRRAGIVPQGFVHGSDFLHFLCGQGEIKQPKVCLDMLWTLGAGDHNIAILHMPAENDLRGGLPIFLPQLRKQRLLQQSLVTMAQRIPRLGNNL